MSLLVIWLLAFPAVSWGQNKNPRLDKLMKKADGYFSTLKHVEALAAYQAVLTEDPNNYKAIYRLGVVNMELSDYKESLKWFRKAVELNPEKNDTVFMNLGLTYKKLNNYMKAKEAFQMFQNRSQDKTGEYYEQANREIMGCDFAETMLAERPAYRVNPVTFNSNAGDMFPSLLDQGQEDSYVVFTSHRVPDGDKPKPYSGSGEPAYSDLYTVVMENDSTFGASERLSVINTSANDGSCSFTGDGLTMYYTICNEGSAKGYGCSIYEAKYDYTKKEWGNPVKVQGLNGTVDMVIYSRGKTKKVPAVDRNPYVTRDGLTMYFASNRTGGRGGMDLWVSRKIGMQWSVPENLGDDINTPFNEISPFINEEGTRLYFASKGHIGFGGYDLYYSEKTEEGGWKSPVNVGAPINSSYDDYASIWMDKDSMAMFTSDRPGGLGRSDIYWGRFVVYPPPVIEIALQGKIRDKQTKQPIPYATAILYEIIDGSINPLDTFKTDQSARYSFRLEKDKKYKVLGNAPEYLANEIEVSTDGMGADAKKDEKYTLERNVDIELEPIVLEKPIVLQNIYYDYDKYYIRPDAAVELNKLAKILQDNPNITIQLGSHTDTNGSDTYNKTLSENRARSVVKYLADIGINPARLTWFGYGESQPIFAPEKDDVEEQANRRTEFRIMSIEFNRL